MNRYKVYVVGHIWWPNGFHSGEYDFNAEDDQEALQRIDGVAGDFSIVTDFELYRCESCPTCGCLTIWHCLREFEEEGAAVFDECMA